MPSGCLSAKRTLPTNGPATAMDVIRGYLKPACGNVAVQKRSDADPQAPGPGKQFRSVRPQLALGRDMPVQGLSGNAEFLAQVTDLRLRLTHGRHRQAELGGRHLERPTAMPAARPRRHQPRHGALSNQGVSGGAREPPTCAPTEPYVRVSPRKQWDGRPHPYRHQHAKVEVSPTT